MILLYENNILRGYTTSVKKAKEFLWNECVKEGIEMYPPEHFKNVNEWWDYKCRTTNFSYIFKFIKIEKLNIKG